MADYYNYNRGPNGSTGGGNDDLKDWIIVVVGLVVFWPVGLVLLMRKLGTSSVGTKNRQNRQHPFDAARNQTNRDAATDSAPGQVNWQSPPTGKTATSGGYVPPHANKERTTGYAPPQYAQKESRRDKTTREPPHTKASPEARRMPNRGWMTILGMALGGVGLIGTLTILAEGMSSGSVNVIWEAFPLLGFMGVGLAFLYAGVRSAHKNRRYRKYLALIGKRESISIDALAKTMPVSVRTACNDLQDMLDLGILPVGYVDAQRGRLILSVDGMADYAPEERTESKAAVADEGEYLLQIKTVNDQIADVEMSRKIDRIGEITGKILDYQRKNPSKAGQLRSFLNYYLPTTLKILHAYAQLEAQGIEGDNITAAKGRIEGMMDKVVEGFEKQLDKLFQNDVLDITTDVEVLEHMLDNDGLSRGEGLRI